MIKPLEGIASFYMPLSRGKRTIVNADNEYLAKYKWSLSYYGYAVRKKPGTKSGIIYLHREIMNAKPNEDVDHIDGNRLNNTRQNLRICTRAQNLYNKPVRSDSKSKIKGVRAVKRVGKPMWQARIAQRHIGYYYSVVDAANAYDREAIKEFGEYALLNNLEGRI